MRYEEKERNRIAEDILLDRRIRTSMYCAKCGYNLRSLPAGPTTVPNAATNTAHEEQRTASFCPTA